MDLLERDLPLALLRERWARAPKDGGAVVVITGEAGVGKTALANLFLDGLEGSLSSACRCL